MPHSKEMIDKALGVAIVERLRQDRDKLELIKQFTGSEKMDKNQKMKKAVQAFNLVNRQQQKQNRIDKLKHIKAMVDDYNTNRLSDEPLMTIAEMAGQLERKC